MFRTLDVQESVEKQVVGFGNGSIVYTPKKWIGKTVLVVLEKKPIDVKAEVLEALKPNLESIEGAFLFGSFARNEQAESSDIDVLVIASKKIEIKKLSKFDFLAKTKEQFLFELKNDHNLFLHQILREARPLINEALLKELKEVKIKPDFSVFFKETFNAFKNVESLLEVDRKRKQKFSDSPASVYSLVLRLRTMFLIQCFRQKQGFSNKKFSGFLQKKGFDNKTVNEFLEVYRTERDNKKTSAKIGLNEAQRLFEAAKKELEKTKKMV